MLAQRNVVLNAQPANPALQCHFITADRVHLLQTGNTVETDLSVVFSGIQFLEVGEIACALLEQKTGSPFALSGAGMVVINRTMLEPSEAGKEFKMRQDSVAAITALVDRVAKEQWGITAFKLIIFGMVEALISYEEHTVSFPVNISIPCTEEQWQQLFQLHNQELTAATEWYKQLQSKSNEQVTAADISPLRNLQ